MRRILVTTGLSAGIVLVAVPAQAFAHDAVPNPYLHAALDVLTLVLVGLPIVTVYAWGARRVGLLVALVTVVQVPVAVIGFLPIADPVVHVGASATAVTLTIASLVAVRRAARRDLALPEPVRQSV